MVYKALHYEIIYVQQRICVCLPLECHFDSMRSPQLLEAVMQSW